MISIDRLSQTLKNTSTSETGLNKYTMKSPSHRRIFESLRFQSPTSDASSSDVRDDTQTDKSLMEVQEKGKGTESKPVRKTMFLV